ncbi:MAG: DUF2155 domain-containing protein [Mariprofundaceae bacterium]|nr:DUF2155 domain-containing protein [Mariprofundaceae bacterium]
MVLVLCSGCDNKQENNIQWQLPLQVPKDVHVSDLHAVLPAWAEAREGHIDLFFLHKDTARKTVVSVVKGQPVEFGIWKIRVLGLAQGLRVKSGSFLDDENVHNAAAFVELLKDDKLMYRGWLYQDFPELFGLDDAGWKIWLKDVNIQPLEEVGSLSSAG